jgi:DNA-3-methyladenine glycosylase
VNRELSALLTGPVVAAAEGLLGRRICSEIGGERTEVVLTEVEAYDGEDDPASHAHRGVTARNRTMFGPPARLYVYRSYGVHWCMNVVTGPEGKGSAVLLRGGRPVVGRAVMERRRGRTDYLTDGPGKLAQALGVTGAHDGISLQSGPLRLLDAVPEPGTILAGPRIGISKATDRPWRFVLTEVI